MYTVSTDGFVFEWDETKERSNLKKHGVSFHDALTVFSDGNALRSFDIDHAEAEDRFLLLGMSARARILMVCHCFRRDGTVIRIISARKADENESRGYWEVRA